MKDLDNLKRQYEALGKEIEDLEKVRNKPMSWEEFISYSPIRECLLTLDEYHHGFSSIWALIPKKYVALRKLELLRDAWGGAHGVESNFYHIKGMGGYLSNVISFNNIDDCRLFEETFSDLIEEAKDLL